MDHLEKPEFAVMCRNLRTNHQPYLKLREVADAIGVARSTYGNVESSRFMVIGQDAAHRIANFYDLNPADRGSLLEAWRKLPLSPHGEKRRKQFARQNAQRSKAKHHDRLMASLAEIIGAWIAVVPAEHVCACSPASVCELCTALENLGLEPFSTVSATVEQLAKLSDKLERARAAQNGATS